jgi:hypothetical protein
MSVSAGPNFTKDGLVLYCDGSNKKSFSQNEFEYSTDIFSWTTTAQRAILSRDNITSPVGNTPIKMEISGNDPYTNTYNSAPWNFAPAQAGQRWIVSVYVKASQATTAEIFIFGANSSGVAYVDGAWLNISAKASSVTTDWTRINHFIDFTNANVAYIHTRLDGTPSGGAGITMWWDGLQIERVPAGVTTPTEFTPFYNGSNVIKNFIGSDTGTISGYPLFVEDDQGTLQFDGSNDFITVPFNASTMDFSSGQTISIWMKPGTGSNSARRNPYNQAYGGPGTITHETNGTLNYYFGTNGNNGTPYVGRNSGFAVTPNELAFITVTRDQISNTSKWYKNGKLITASDAGGYAVTANGTSPILIGNGYTSNFIGNIYGVAVYNRALTEAEVARNFNSTRGRFGL